MAKGFKPKPRKKAVNPILKDKFRSDQLGLDQLKQDAARTIKYGPKGHLKPQAGTNESFS